MKKGLLNCFFCSMGWTVFQNYWFFLQLLPGYIFGFLFVEIYALYSFLIGCLPALNGKKWQFSKKLA